MRDKKQEFLDAFCKRTGLNQTNAKFVLENFYEQTYRPDKILRDLDDGAIGGFRAAGLWLRANPVEYAEIRRKQRAARTERRRERTRNATFGGWLKLQVDRDDNTGTVARELGDRTIERMKEVMRELRSLRMSRQAVCETESASQKNYRKRLENELLAIRNARQQFYRYLRLQTEK